MSQSVSQSVSQIGIEGKVDIHNYVNFSRVHLHMEKGDTVFFHPLIIHGSGTNISPNFRKAISCHYSTTNIQYIDVKGTSQENIAKEVEDVAERRGFGGIGFTELWRQRSRDVRGAKASL